MPRILVTGANGFIAAHCIARLLQSKLLVRGTVRSAAKAEATRAALVSAGIDVTNMELVAVPDLMDTCAMASAMVNCDAVLHLASAFTYDAKPGEFEEKLLLPAVRGTTAVCEAAAEHECVKKVVIMSSFAAVYDAAKGPQPGKVYTEEDWSPLSYEEGRDATMVPTAYRASKVLAEKAAWDFVKSRDVHYTLVTLCPGMVFGRMIHPIESLAQLNASNQIVWEVLRQKDCIPPTRAPVWVDVDDLAIISLKALTVDLASHERFLLTAGPYDTQEIADILRVAIPERQHRIAVGEPGKRIWETHYSCDASKVQRVLEVEFRALEESLIPLARQLYDLEARY